MLLNSHISAYARCLAGKVCGLVRSTWGTSLGEDKLGARDKMLNTKVACWHAPGKHPPEAEADRCPVSAARTPRSGCSGAPNPDTESTLVRRACAGCAAQSPPPPSPFPALGTPKKAGVMKPFRPHVGLRDGRGQVAWAGGGSDVWGKTWGWMAETWIRVPGARQANAPSLPRPCALHVPVHTAQPLLPLRLLVWLGPRAQTCAAFGRRWSAPGRTTVGRQTTGTASCPKVAQVCASEVLTDTLSEPLCRPGPME